MKSLYVCEKCGAQYEDYDEAIHCEQNHFHIGFDFSNQTALEGKRCTYKQGDKMPQTCVLASSPDYAEGYDNPRHYFGMYKLVRMLSESEVQEILDEKAAQDAENRRVLEEWRKEKEAKKAEEQTA